VLEFDVWWFVARFTSKIFLELGKERWLGAAVDERLVRLKAELGSARLYN
jgi:hypothetical protein